MPLFRRKPEQSYLDYKFVWLENTGDKHIKLNMASGDLRLDMGRKYRFLPDILEDAQVKNLISAGHITLQE